MKVGGLDILIGADPEVFVSNGLEFVSAHGMVGGTKQFPQKVKNGAVQVDGMALEFNIDPAKNKAEFVRNLNSVMKQLERMVPAYKLQAVPVAHFSKQVIESAPAEALEMGCDPDLNAYDEGRPNPKPDGSRDYRTGAGHIHIGWTKDEDVNNPEHIEACIMLTKQLDKYLGLPSLLYDKDNVRRSLYGKAGAFRVKPYGVEYRVLSNVWLKDRRLMEWVYENTILAIRNLLKGVVGEDRGIPHFIDQSDADRALLLCRAAGIPLPPEL